MSRPDIVHTHLFYADTFGRVAARLAGVPAVVSTEHSTERGALSWRRRAGMSWTTPFVHRIAAVSEPVRQQAARRLGLAESRLVVIPNGIEFEPWARAEPLPRAALGVEENALLVGCVGRLDTMKGHDALLEAIARLGQPQLRLVVAGDGPERARLEARARELGIEDAVRWLGWRDDVPRFLKTLDVFVMPSRFEGHSMALLEAMAAGCACIVSDIPELHELLGGAGLRVPVGDTETLAQQLRRLSADSELRQRCGREAQQRAQCYSIDTSARRYLQLYRDMLGRAAPPGGAR